MNLNRDYGVLGHQIALREQALSKNFNTAHSRKRKSNSRLMKP